MRELLQKEKLLLSSVIQKYIDDAKYLVSMPEDDPEIDDLVNIAVALELPEYDSIGIQEEDPGDMDGDATTALASAGFGTDEDYGGTDERF